MQNSHTMTSPCPPRARPSFKFSGRLLIASRRFFWYSSSIVSVAMPLPRAPVMRLTAPAAPPAHQQTVLYIWLSASVKGHSTLHSETKYDAHNKTTQKHPNTSHRLICALVPFGGRCSGLVVRYRICTSEVVGVMSTATNFHQVANLWYAQTNFSLPDHPDGMGDE